jgi:hypothetical protein
VQKPQDAMGRPESPGGRPADDDGSRQLLAPGAELATEEVGDT